MLKIYPANKTYLHGKIALVERKDGGLPAPYISAEFVEELLSISHPDLALKLREKILSVQAAYIEQVL